jgi:hypothetical protein
LQYSNDMGLISKHYEIREFVPPEIYQLFGERSIWFIDQRIVLLADWMCDYFGSHVVINNWHTGGQYHESGFRDPMTGTGAARSAHKRGIAADFKIKDIDPEFARDEIRKNFDALHSRFGITTIEQDTPSWLHVDLRWTNQDTLLEVPFQ